MLLRWPWMKLVSKGFDRQALVLAYNLDWFSRPSSLHFRWEWLLIAFNLIIAGIAVPYAGAVYDRMLENEQSADPGEVFIMILIGLLMPAGWAVIESELRRNLMLDGLRRLIRERYGIVMPD